MSDILTFTPPDPARLRRQLSLQRFWFAPQYFGLEHLDPARPALYVGNHTLYGVLDAPLMVLGVYEKTGIYFRSLGDHMHFRLPGWGTLLRAHGAVPGTPENCSQLMQAGEHIVVYPGGAREVMKNRGEEYRLVWKQRTGFARMALQHGYDIIPFAAIGADDVYRIRYDSQTFRQSWAGRLAERSGLLQRYFRGGDTFGPVISGILPAACCHGRKKCISCSVSASARQACRRPARTGRRSGSCGMRWRRRFTGKWMPCLPCVPRTGTGPGGGDS